MHAQRILSHRVPVVTPDPHALPLFQAKAPAPHGWPLLRLGFRPFYLGAAAFAALAVPAWVAAFLGWLHLEPVVAPLLWHAHEMLFGFAAAVIVGFLLTAGKAWTGLATPRGAFLGALAALWLAARITALTGPHALYAVLDLVLLPLVAAVLLDVLLRARNRRNLPVAGLLLLLALANGLFHLAAIGAVALPPLRALHAGLALIVMIECVIGGRVVPAFTASATPGVVVRAKPRFEAAALGITALGLGLWVLAPATPAAVGALALAAVLQALRQSRWHPLVTRRRPILWVLHAAFAWIPIGLALLAAAGLGLVAESAGVHALAVGATGGLVIGMITRTARGHTGRPIVASRAEVAAYALVIAAALLRVVVPLAAPGWLVPALVAAALAFAGAFVLYLCVFAPWLASTRLDGKDG